MTMKTYQDNEPAPCDMCGRPTLGRDAVRFYMQDGLELDPPQAGTVPLCDLCRLCPVCEDYIDLCNHNN